MKNKVIFVRGIQGSGKSTWAKEWVKEDATHRIRISWDDMRRMFGPYWIPERESLLKTASVSILKDALEYGNDVVIDNMNLNERTTQLFRDVCDVYGAEIEYKDFKTPVEECIERDSHRTGTERIGEQVIRNTYDKYKWFYEN